MKTIGEIIEEKNLHLDTLNPVLAEGFIQMPNFILRRPVISVGAKATYTMLLNYAWQEESCHVGQDRLAVDLRISRPRVTGFIGELKRLGLLSIQRRGQRFTNIYTLHFPVSSMRDKNSPINHLMRPRNFFDAGLTKSDANVIVSTQVATPSTNAKNLHLDTTNPALQVGFTQIPAFILKKADISLGAAIAYAMFLSYAWYDDLCYPGQDRLAEDMGVSRSYVTEFVGELKQAGLISVTRRGQGLTNIYNIHFQVQPRRGRKFLMSAGRHQEVDLATSESRQGDFSL